MFDVFTKKKRSWVMSRIKSKHTKIEQVLQKALRKVRFKFLLHQPITGKPDVVFLRHRLAVFVDGCFWHKCPTHYVKPVTRKDFWEAKISGNVKRDLLVNQKLKESGWSVLRFWEHDVEKNPEQVARRINKFLKMRHELNL